MVKYTLEYDCPWTNNIREGKPAPDSAAQLYIRTRRMFLYVQVECVASQEAQSPFFIIASIEFFWV
jgi:hypothetical protein